MIRLPQRHGTTLLSLGRGGNLGEWWGTDPAEPWVTSGSAHRAAASAAGCFPTSAVSQLLSSHHSQSYLCLLQAGVNHGHRLPRERNEISLAPPQDPAMLVSCTVPALKVLHAFVPPDLPLGASGERKEKGNYTRSVCIHIPSISPLHKKASPCTSPCNRCKSTAASFHAVLTACASAKCHLSSQPMEVPPGPAAGASSSRDQPVEPVHCCTQVGAQELPTEPGCSCIEQYWLWQWLEHFGFCIRVILTLQSHKMQLHFKWSYKCFSGTSISLQWRRNKANSVGKVQGSTNLNLLHFSGFFCYLNTKLHGFRQSAHLQFFRLFFLCCWEPHNVPPCQLLKCF